MQGQQVANQLNKKFEDEQENSFFQDYFAKHPMAKMGAMMGKLPLMMMPAAAGGYAGAGMLGVGGLMSAANKQQSNRDLVDFKRTEGLRKTDPGSINSFDIARSVGGGVKAVSNPLMTTALLAQAAGMLTGTPGLNTVASGAMQGSMLTRSPLMALQALSGMGLGEAMTGAAGAKSAEHFAGIAADKEVNRIKLIKAILTAF